MADTLLERVAYLGVSETDKTFANKRRIVMRIEKTIPFVMVSSNIITNNTINEKITALATVVNNTLVDELDATRFTYLTTTHSTVSNNIVRIYHDSLYGDLIVVPDLDNLGTGAMTDPNTNITYILGCSRIAGGEHLANDSYDGSIGNNNLYKIPTPIASVASKHMSVKLNGISPVYGNRNGFYDIGATGASFNISDARQLPTGLLDIGLTADVFGPNAILPVYNVYMYDNENYKMRYLNNHAVSSFYILLDF